MNVFFLKAGSHIRAYSYRMGSESSKLLTLHCPSPTERAVQNPVLPSATPSNMAALPLLNPWPCSIVGMSWNLHLEAKFAQFDL